MQEDLYAKICSLSYMGDLRMLFAEDKNKVIFMNRFYEIEGILWTTFLKAFVKVNIAIQKTLSGTSEFAFLILNVLFSLCF